MNKQLLKDILGWGILLWLIGYILGIILFMIVPPSMIGWVIMPIGITITLWVLLKKIKGNSFQYYSMLAFIWTLIAIVFDYFLLVKMFKPADGYYKLDVYLYYVLTFVLPLIVGWKKRHYKNNVNLIRKWHQIHARLTNSREFDIITTLCQLLFLFKKE